mmetsp:Transcript_30641/g.45351  ORF Transcript_30641/g.45351 Transcript_30641/m.45351 type:complete len:203 (-) Transcript_30641:482-1090(-)
MKACRFADVAWANSRSCKHDSAISGIMMDCETIVVDRDTSETASVSVLETNVPFEGASRDSITMRVICRVELSRADRVILHAFSFIKVFLAVVVAVQVSRNLVLLQQWDEIFQSGRGSMLAYAVNRVVPSNDDVVSCAGFQAFLEPVELSIRRRLVRRSREFVSVHRMDSAKGIHSMCLSSPRHSVNQERVQGLSVWQTLRV